MNPLKWYISGGLNFFEILHFSKKMPLIFFCNRCFYATVQKFSMLDYVILMYATILGIILKSLVSICSQKSSFLVGKAYLRKADACNHKKDNNF